MNGSPASHTSAAGTRPADLVLLDGQVTTLDDRWPEAQAVAVHDDLITAVGTTQEIEASVGPRTEVIDLAGRRVIPGFVEGHGHLLALGHSLAILNLGDAGDWPEIVERVRKAARGAAPGAWIEGGGWHLEKWRTSPGRSVEGFPVHDALSQAAPGHPVLL